jgi:hypothetical protein
MSLEKSNMVPSYFREKSGVDDAGRDYKNNQECAAVIFAGIIDRRYYLTIREGGAESLQDLVRDSRVAEISH